MPIFDVFPLLNDRDLLAMHDGVKRAMQEDDKHPKKSSIWSSRARRLQNSY